MERILLLGDTHALGDPSALSEELARKQYFPSLFMNAHVPLGAVRWALQRMRASYVTAITRVNQQAAQLRCDGVITLGDQIHGIAERGIVGEEGVSVAEEFLHFLSDSWVGRRSAPRFTVHVPSKGPLGYWDGEDDCPWIVKRTARAWFGRRHVEFPYRTFEFPHVRDIGGGMNGEAVANWLRMFGPLWGSVEVEGWRLVWMDCDLTRWGYNGHRSAQIGPNGETLLQLAKQQERFLETVLRPSVSHQNILFCHRLESALSCVPVWNAATSLHAIVYADAHHPALDAKRKRKLLSKPAVRDQFQTCKLWFVPAVWGLQFGIGKPGFATLELDEDSATFQQYFV